MTRILFMGSPEIAIPSLQALHEAGHEIAGVFTQPDKPKGRGREIGSPPVKLAAEKLGRKVFQPPSLRDPKVAETIRSLHPEAIAVVAYGKILPPEILKIPERGCINLHFSLLPKYRGAACVAYALLNGDDETGVTTILMDEGMDTGPILMQWSEPILPEDTAETLAPRLADLGARQLVKTVEEWARKTLDPVPQPERGVSYAPLLKKEMGAVDWNQSAREIVNRYRGLTPWPGLFTFLEGKRTLLTKLRFVSEETQGRPGAIQGSAGRMLVSCGSGTVEVLSLKPEGKKILSAAEFMRGWPSKKDLQFCRN
jgi:methionyl-tRNA formyltransferase